MNNQYLKKIISAKFIFVLVFAFGFTNVSKSQITAPINYKSIVGFNDTIFAITDSVQWLKFNGDSTITEILLSNILKTNNANKATIYKRLANNQLQLQDSFYSIYDLWQTNNILIKNINYQNAKDYFIKVELESTDTLFLSARMINANNAVRNPIFCPLPPVRPCNLISNPCFHLIPNLPLGYSANNILGYTGMANGGWGDPFQDNGFIGIAPPPFHPDLVSCWENGSTTPMVKSLTMINPNTGKVFLPAGPNGVFPQSGNPNLNPLHTEFPGNAAFMSAARDLQLNGSTDDLSESILNRIPELVAGERYRLSYYVRKFNNSDFINGTQYLQTTDPSITIKLLDEINLTNSGTVNNVPTYSNLYPNELSPSIDLLVDNRPVTNDAEWEHYIICFSIPLNFHAATINNRNPDYILIAADIPNPLTGGWLTGQFQPNVAGSFYIADLELIVDHDNNQLCFTPPIPLVGDPCFLFGSTFNWTGPNNFIANNTTTFTPSIPGIYSVRETLLTFPTIPPSSSNTQPIIQGSCNFNKTYIVNQPPILPTDADTWVVCSGTNITLGMPTPQNKNYSYNWSIPALGIAYYTPTITLTPSITPAQLIVYLTVTDNITGCTNSRIYTVRVNPTPNPVIQGPNVLCGVGVITPAPFITLNSSITSSNYTYSWAVVTNPVPLIPPIPLPNATNWIPGTQYNAPTLTTHTGGGYYLKITDNTTGCSAMSPVFPVIEGDIPVVTLSEPFYKLCSASILPPPNNPYFSNWAYTTATVAPYTYSWTSTIAGTFNPTNSTTTPALSNYVDFIPSPGSFSSFNYSVTVTDALGCHGSATCVVTVNPSPTISVVSPTICYGTSATLTANGGTTGGTYIWSFNPNGVPALQSSSSNTFNTGVLNTTTTYYVKYIDAKGCDANAAAIVTVTPKINLSFSASPSVLCSNASSTLVGVNVSGGTPPYNSASWNPTLSSPNNTANYFSGNFNILNGNSIFFQIYDSRQCATSGTFTLNYGTAPVINMPTDVIYCTNTTGKSIVASFTGTAPFSNIFWTASPSSSTFIFNNTATGSTINTAPSSLTSYTLHVTDVNGCSTTKQVNVQPHTAAFNLYTSNSLYCDFVPVTISAASTSDVGGINPSTPNTFSWTPAGITNSIYQNSVSVQPSALTTYSVTMTDNYGCVATHNTNVDNNCCTGVGITLPTLISSFIASNPSNMVTNGTYSFLAGSVPHKVIMGGNYYVPANQTLIIDDNIEFFLCNIFMGTNSKIVVNDPKFLYLTNYTNIKSCQNMWNGIYMTTSNINNPMTVNLFMDNSTLKDAIDGVVSNAGAVFYINNSTFDRNLTSLTINPFQSLPHSGVIKNSTITCSVPFLRFPYNNTPSKVGIAIKDVKNITISNNSISNCKDYGIKVTGGTSLVFNRPVFHNNFVQINNNTFSNCNTAIYLKANKGNLHHNIIGASFNYTGQITNWSGYKGIEVTGLPLNHKVDINDNTFNMLNTAILTRFNNSSVININRNTISSVLNSGSVASNLRLSCGIANDELDRNITITATDNHIYNCNIGFYLRNLKANFVSRKNPTYQHQYYNNDVHLNTNGILTNADNMGFYMENCFGNMIQCNTIDYNMNQGDYQFNINDYGIYLKANSNYNFIDGNQLQDITNGLQAENANIPNYLIANNFDDNVYGIVLHNNGELGDIGKNIPPINLYSNTHWGNQWTNLLSASSVTLSYGGVSNSILRKIYVRPFETAPFYYSGSNAPFVPPLSNSILFDFSTTLNGSLASSIPSLAGCETTYGNRVVKNATVSEDMLRAAQDTTYSTEEEGMTQFFNRLALYSVLQQADSSLREEEILETFVDMEQYQTIGKFYNAQTELKLAYDSSLYSVDSLPNEINDSINDAIKHEHLNNAMTYLSDINSNLLSVQYYQQINQLYINYLLNDSLDVNQLQSAKDIAALCIYTYGAAVSNARSLTALLDSTATWNDNATCYGANRMKQEANEAYLNGIVSANAEKKSNVNKMWFDKSNLNLFPNPANDVINLFLINELTQGKIIIYNSLGIKVIEQEIMKGKLLQTIPIQSLSNGLYIVRIQSNDGVNKGQGRFIVNK